MRSKALLSLCLMTSVAFLSGCAKETPPALPYLDEEIFEPELEYAGPMLTLGDLTRGHVENTTALRRANNKLRTLCLAARRCEDEDE